MASPNHIWAGLSTVQELATVSMISRLIDPSYYDDTLVTSNTTYIPQITGKYVVLCVGAGAAGYFETSTQSGAGGGAGGCGYIETTLYAGTSYPVTIAQSNSGAVTSFGDIIQCTSGTAATSVSTPGINGTCLGEGATNIMGTAPTNGTAITTTVTKYDTFSKQNWSMSYRSAGVAGQIGEYPNYNFSVNRRSTTLSSSIFIRATQTSPTSGSESTVSTTSGSFSQPAYGAYGIYGLGGFGGSYFIGAAWQYMYQNASTWFMYNVKACIYIDGLYLTSGQINQTNGSPGCVVVKLLSL